MKATKRIADSAFDDVEAVVDIAVQKPFGVIHNESHRRIADSAFDDVGAVVDVAVQKPFGVIHN
jgi:ligand-binding SRPBCC domain-containing protein